MAEPNKDNKNKKPKGFVIGISPMTIFYFLLAIGLFWMLYSRNSASSSPEKVEWAEVQAMIANGDVDEISYIRNDYQGEVKIKPDGKADDDEEDTEESETLIQSE